MWFNYVGKYYEFFLNNLVNVGINIILIMKVLKSILKVNVIFIDLIMIFFWNINVKKILNMINVVVIIIGLFFFNFILIE